MVETKTDINKNQPGPRGFADWLNSEAFKKSPRRIPSGFPDLDSLLDGGFIEGGMYTLAGRTGEGKSTIAQNIARRAGLGQIRSLLISLEDPGVQVVRKIIAASAQLEVRKIESFTLSVADERRFRDAHTTLADIALEIDQDTAALDKIDQLIRASGAEGTKLVIVDQMSWVIATGTTFLERASEISRRLKSAARAANIVLIVCCQVNRDGSKKSAGPNLFDLRDSGTIEQDSDGVLMVKSVIDMAPRPSIIKLALEKHRHGQTGACQLCWFKSQSRIEHYSPDMIAGPR